MNTWDILLLMHSYSLEILVLIQVDKFCTHRTKNDLWHKELKLYSVMLCSLDCLIPENSDVWPITGNEWIAHAKRVVSKYNFLFRFQNFILKLAVSTLFELFKLIIFFKGRSSQAFGNKNLHCRDSKHIIKAWVWWNEL